MTTPLPTQAASEQPQQVFSGKPAPRTTPWQTPAAPGAEAEERALATGSAPPWPAPPTEVSCVVRGKSNPFPRPCEDATATVSSKDGSPLVRFPTEKIDVVWGLTARPEATWVHARSGGMTATGYTPIAQHSFRLANEVMILEDHVWLLKNAPLQIKTSRADGVRVKVLSDLGGVDAIPARVACTDLAFELAEPEPPVDEAVTAMAAPRLMYPAQKTLTLRTAAAGSAIAVLTVESPNLPMSLELTVAAETRNWLNVRFKTAQARFDVWVDRKEVSEEALGIGGIGLAGCGGSVDRMGQSSSEIARTIPVRLGKSPQTADRESLWIAEGTLVGQGAVVDGFVEIYPLATLIYPVEENSFWVPLAELR